MARDAEIRLRDRLSKLGGLDLLRGARLSGELERLQRQLDRIEAEPTDEEIWTQGRARPPRGAAVHARLRRADPRRLVRAARRPRPGRRRRDRDRHRQAREPHGRADRPPEGPRHQGADAAELRHGLSGGLPEGDARDGARRPAPLPARDARRHARRLPGRRGRAARPGRRDRPLAGGDGAARACRRSPS